MVGFMLSPMGFFNGFLFFVATKRMWPGGQVSKVS